MLNSGTFFDMRYIQNIYRHANRLTNRFHKLCRIVDPSFAQAHPQIPWREMYGLRNRIVHDYEGVNLQLVWEIISEDIPELRCQI